MIDLNVKYFKWKKFEDEEIKEREYKVLKKKKMINITLMVKKKYLL